MKSYASHNVVGMTLKIGSVRLVDNGSRYCMFKNEILKSLTFFPWYICGTLSLNCSWLCMYNSVCWLANSNLTFWFLLYETFSNCFVLYSTRSGSRNVVASYYYIWQKRFSIVMTKSLLSLILCFFMWLSWVYETFCPREGGLRGLCVSTSFITW